MSKAEAFIYKWINLTNGKIYIGYHKGNLNDGYVCSSHNKLFWDDFHNPKMQWKRDILYKGTSAECLLKEQEILRALKFDDKLYNRAKGANIIFTSDVKQKMSESHKRYWSSLSEKKKIKIKQKISKSKKGIPRSEITKKKLSKFFKGKTLKERFGFEEANKIKEKIRFKQKGQKRPLQSKKMKGRYIGENNPMFGKTHSIEFKEKQRERFLKNNPGKNKTKETIDKIKRNRSGIPSKNKGIKRKQVICPHCHVGGGEGIMERWHFTNCKYKK